MKILYPQALVEILWKSCQLIHRANLKSYPQAVDNVDKIVDFLKA